MSKKEGEFDELTNLLAATNIAAAESGVSFVGKSLKLNTESDAQEVIDAIKACKNMTVLNLEGNTIGVDAAKGIAKALESHSEFKRALWKDIFTGRSKTEIPDALRYLGSGLKLANANLTELDMSDNAFGPIGLEGLVSLLKSPVCYTLQQLRLNNNGLGITGGKLLSKALLSCYEDSKSLNKPFALKVFIAGRNRLENDGAKALSEVFKKLQSLEEIVMPQNGIYYPGITALADALQHNKNLKVLDFNDNTVSKRGSYALAAVLPKLTSLENLNLGDCLLKTKGAIDIAESLSTNHKIKEVNLSCNEITKRGGLAIADILCTKPQLKCVNLDGNQFGEEGTEIIKAKLEPISKNTLITFEDDEGSEDESGSNDEDGGDETEEEDEEEEKESDEGVSPEVTVNAKENGEENASVLQHVSAADFLSNPIPEKFLTLGNNRAALIIAEIKKQPEESYLEAALASIMKVSSLCTSNNTNIKSCALDCSNVLYKELFEWAAASDKMTIVNNSLLVHLGLLKSEDKKFKVLYNIEGCRIAVQHAMNQEFFPPWSKDTIKLFINRQIKTISTIVL